jgi:MoxR-like ATPase
MKYDKVFDPKAIEIFSDEDPQGVSVGDRRKNVYVYNDQIVLAVNIAMVTGRPILVRGPSGYGKSSLARNVAKVLKWRYYEEVISSGTQAQDLLWEVDLLRRLQDAQMKKLKTDLLSYIRPGVLWWAFDRESAQERGGPEPGDGRGDPSKAVVLLDEIDKADPDVPNNLLVPLGSLCFQVEGTDITVACKEPPLLFLTTNEERELPPAFLRRCVELKLSEPDLVTVGKAHFPHYVKLIKKVAQILATPRENDRTADFPSPAEYLDTLRACIDLKIRPKSDIWDSLKKVTVWKHGRSPGGMS